MSSAQRLQKLDQPMLDLNKYREAGPKTKHADISG
jgi:hypothetical protein